MHQQDGLRGALLARVGVCVVVAHVRYVVNLMLMLRDIRPQHFPVKSAIFESYSAIQRLYEVFANLGRPSKQSHACVGKLEHFLHDGAFRVHQIKVLFGQTAVVKHANPLLERNADTRAGFNERLVSHIESAHHLQNRDFKREVKGCNHADGAKRPPVRCVVLTKVVPWHLLGLRKEADAVATEVLEEIYSHIKFCLALRGGLGSDSLDELDEEVEHLGIIHALNNAAVHFREHQIPLLILKRIVQARFRAFLKALNKWVDFIDRRVRQPD